MNIKFIFILWVFSFLFCFSQNKNEYKEEEKDNITISISSLILSTMFSISYEHKSGLYFRGNYTSSSINGVAVNIFGTVLGYRRYFIDADIKNEGFFTTAFFRL